MKQTARKKQRMGKKEKERENVYVFMYLSPKQSLPKWKNHCILQMHAFQKYLYKILYDDGMLLCSIKI